MTHSPLVFPFFEKDTATCQYIVADPESKEAVLIDSVLDYNPASGQISTTTADGLLAFVHDQGFKVKMILETHAHADHLTAANYLKTKLGSGVRVAIGQGITHVQSTFAKIFNLTIKTDGSQFDHLWTDGEEWNLGTINCKTMNTPGHTSDSVTYLIGDCAFAGDSIFMPDVGTARCDFPGGSSTILYESIKKLLSLPDNVRVYVGHDYPPEGRPVTFETSILKQRTENKHVNEKTSLEEFSEWRAARDKTLGAPRLLYPALQVNIRAGRLPEPETNGSVYFKVPIKASF